MITVKYWGYIGDNLFKVVLSLNESIAYADIYQPQLLKIYKSESSELTLIIHQQ